MDAVKRDYWYSMVHVVFLSLLKVAYLQMALGSIVKLEESMTLDCMYPWNGTLSMVDWKKVSESQMPVVVYHPEYGTKESPGYTGRVTLLKSSPLDGSISLSNVTDQDVGLYRCSMQTFPGGSWTRDVLVKKAVEFDHSEADKDVRVELGDDFSIHCNHTSNQTVHQVAFEKARGKIVQTLGLCYHLANGSLQAVRYKDTLKVNCGSILNASLHLTNASEEDAGFYRCLFDVDVAGQTTLLTVSQKGSIIFPQYVIYIGAGVAGLVIVGLTVITVLACWHRKKQRAKVRAKCHPLQRSLLNNYEQPGISKKMKKRTKRQEEPIYCNIGSHLRQTKRNT